ncbi:phage shock protein operon transcriptional activator [Polymorphobacter megasporae]|uniref:phage shock protein operon transcriptional activator n=1 Tax=Glacieibacterium megasporae TaxID=2835787 RepID=UPI001C1E759D|nr:phage shock protein operon transcriptional activator [Polymorphobacter megasporae]UAJ10399.1 phage shock protein operon transcriptional activator [Polymorphobacter megasporae]
MQSPAALIGHAPSFLDAIEHATRAAAINRPVLVIGERGTGKELIAERLHRLSPRWSGPLITLNCAALPENLLDAELFGYDTGAFTGATRGRPGRFEDADGGTLFLDEIATLSQAAQERLLRVVEYGELTRLGSNRVIRVDVRVVGATNEDLPALVAAHQFRADLLDRLSFEVVTLPPLRARADDILVLAGHFARRMAVELGWAGFTGFSEAAEHALAAHDWPGNVRELKNVVERSLYRWGDAVEPVGHIVFDAFDSPYRPGIRHLPSIIAANDAPALPALVAPESGGSPAIIDHSSIADLRLAVASYERDILTAALAKCRHNQRATATALALTYDQLRHALKRHNML